MPAFALLLAAMPGGEVQAQSAAEWLLSPVADSAPAGERTFDPERRETQKPPRRFQRAGGQRAGNTQRIDARDDDVAPSRVGRIPTYGTPPASGAGATGFDSSNRRRVVEKPRAQRLSQPIPDNAAPTRGNRTPVSASVAGTVPGQPQRRRLKIDDDPFAATGFHAGSFVVKPAVEIYGGYDSNPGRVANGRGSGFYRVAPEFVATSVWERHALGVDLRGSFTGYGHAFEPPPGTPAGFASPIPRFLERPDFTGKVNGRIDVSHDTKIDAEARLSVATDNPGSPDIRAGLERYPLSTGYGGTLGLTQTFNRLEFQLKGATDRVTYRASVLTDGSTVSNADRDYDQVGTSLRASYELTPGVKPFVEGGLDWRTHDENVDRSGISRNSRGTTFKAGTSFELTRLLTGEISAGMQTRDYDDPSLQRLNGLLVDASLIWSATPLTSVKFLARSSVNESTLAGVSGVLVREYGVELNHDFRRWLSASAKFSTGTSTYEGSTREDRSSLASLALVYKLTRTAQIKGEFRREWLTSSVPGSDYTANVVMVGLRLQR